MMVGWRSVFGHLIKQRNVPVALSVRSGSLLSCIVLKLEDYHQTKIKTVKALKSRSFISNSNVLQ